MVDVASIIKALNCRWVGRIAKGKGENWIVVMECYFERFGGIDQMFSLNLDKKGLIYISKQLPTFYKGVVHSWYELAMNSNTVPMTPNKIGEQIIWGNHFITCTPNKHVLFFKEWIDAGVFLCCRHFQKWDFCTTGFYFTKVTI